MTRWTALLVVALGALPLTGCGSDDQGASTTELPSGAVATVAGAPDETVTQGDFDRALAQTAARQGINRFPRAPTRSTRRSPTRRSPTCCSRAGCSARPRSAGSRSPTARSPTKLEKVKSQQFGSEKAFQTFLDQSGFTLDEAQQRIELQLISSQIQQDVLDDLQSGAGGQEAAQQLAAKQQQLATQFQTEFQERWRSRTNCADGYLIDQCANGPQPQSPKADQIAPTP